MPPYVDEDEAYERKRSKTKSRTRRRIRFENDDRNARIIDCGYDAYAREEGHYDDPRDDQ